MIQYHNTHLSGLIGWYCGPGPPHLILDGVCLIRVITIKGADPSLFMDPYSLDTRSWDGVCPKGALVLGICPDGAPVLGVCSDVGCSTICWVGSV